MTKDTLVTQVKLFRPVSEGVRHTLTTWVDADSRLKKGVTLELKKDNRRWTVEEVYGTRTAGDIDARGWDNNNYDKHKGLFA